MMFRPKGPTLILICILYINCKATYARQIGQDLDLGTLLDEPLEVNLVNLKIILNPRPATKEIFLGSGKIKSLYTQARWV